VVAVAILIVATVAAVLFCRNGALGVIPDVLIWPQLRDLKPEEDKILTPFVAKVHDLMWAGALGMVSCLCGGFLAG
jgi:hypothetical protein